MTSRLEYTHENMYYPVFLDLRDKLCVVIGGGRVAQRKVESLVSAGARVKVISGDILDEISSIDGVILEKRKYEDGDLKGAFLVIAATDDPDENLKITREAKARGILLNVVDKIELCNFIMPSVVEKGPLKIAISTGGFSPALARRLRVKIGKYIGEEFEILARILARIRPIVVGMGGDANMHKRIFEVLIDSSLLDAIREGNREQVNDIIYQALGIQIDIGDLLL